MILGGKPLKKYYFIPLICLSLALLGVLTGCQKPKETFSPEVSSKKVKTSTTNKQAADKQATPKKNKKPVYWSESAQEELANFMEDWGEQMEQSYQSYTPKEPVYLLGTSLPNDLLTSEPKVPVKFADAPITLNWSKDGVSQPDYNLVGVYSDSQKNSVATSHVYFFVIYKEQPSVWILDLTTSSNTSFLSFKETENSNLTNGFAEIVEQTRQTSSNSSETKQSDKTSHKIDSFNDAADYALSHKDNWQYEDPNIHSTSVEVISLNINYKEQETNELGSFYRIVFQTNDNVNELTKGMKQFRVYTNGRIEQRKGMEEFEEIVSPNN
ncbi:hypothetical protein C7P63_02715 [Vagococcus humatus]|uniref:DUF4767 domain-containing protein n=1 Tax=Vagococcus humatus TaxID=1889241 RepID=A0A3S0A6F7_9ENTE|nr:hypothetical protein C7P63_02715 [Vagococcus humatus]